jgi:glycosyltransferase involved in cell wall biosynthesis
MPFPRPEARNGRGFSVGDVPDEIRRLAEERERARTARDFGAADDLRERIRRGGFEVTDTPDGPQLSAHPSPARAAREAARLRPNDVESLLGDPPSFDASVQWIVEGWPLDVVRGIESFRSTGVGERSVQHVVVDLTDREGWPQHVDVIRLDRGTGWAAARNAGLQRTAGEIVLLVDGSVEATGEVIGPLVDTLRDRSVGLTGPFGLVTDDLREFRESPGPECDAVEGYLMAFRRSLLAEGPRFDERFKYYRSADIEFSFQVRARGLRATVTQVPVRRHEHRMWANTPEDRRERLSKRNFYRFLERWRERMDLTVGAGGGG